MKIIALLLLFLLLPPAYAPPSDFKVWAQRSGLFTVGKKEQVHIYVQNLVASTGSYEIVYNKTAQYNLNDVSHLVQVSIPSNRINIVGQNEVKSTFATVVMQGPITSGQINFIVRSLSDSSENVATVTLTASMPTSLPEFGLASVAIIIILSSVIFFVQKSYDHDR